MKKLIQKIIHSQLGRLIVKELLAILFIKLSNNVQDSKDIPDDIKPILKNFITNTTPDILDDIIDGKDEAYSG
jgi:hypothetical protein